MVQSVLAAMIPGVEMRKAYYETDAGCFPYPSKPHSTISLPPRPQVTESKGNYLKVAQQGTADGRGRNRGGTGGAQQAWPLPEASKGAPGRGGDTQCVGLKHSGMLTHVLGLTLCHYLGLLPWGPLP